MSDKDLIQEALLSTSAPANEYGDAEEREAEYKDHAATVTSEPTDAQIEAGLKKVDWDAIRAGEADPEEAAGVAVRAALEAALVAAQGAAPQAAMDIHEPSHDRVYCVRCGGNWPCQPAPVLPSSGVDEDALAEVIEDAIRVNWEVFNNRQEEAQIIARAVAEWLKGQQR